MDNVYWAQSERVMLPFMGKATIDKCILPSVLKSCLNWVDTVAVKGQPILSSTRRHESQCGDSLECTIALLYV